jgi:putative endonuclease
MEKHYFVYIMSNTSKVIYTGVTNNVDRRVFEHESKLIPGFTRKYNLHKLVYFETFGNINGAICREKKIKGWLRSNKVALITASNPLWLDLSADHFTKHKRASMLSSWGPFFGPKDLSFTWAESD